jgi:uncharacterized protein
MINRSILPAIKEMMKYFPIIAITGPRQSGKTTMLKMLFSDFKYISFEDPDNRLFFEKDPRGFFEIYNQKTIFDEAQRVPDLFSYLQGIVDNSGKMGQYILSGSQNFNLLNNITQSLAGRVALLKLMPFDFQELSSAQLLGSNPYEVILKGCYPALYSRSMLVGSFYSNYIETYIERDLSTLLQVKDLRLFRTFVKMCAARIGKQLNITTLSTDIGISLPTVKTWLSILESSYILYQLPPFFNNFNKRLVKSTKLYFYDTGLACFLLGIKNVKTLQEGEYSGHLFENMIVNEYMKQNYHFDLHHDFYYWRDSNDHEVDLLVSNGTAYDIVEIKSTKTILPPLFKGLDLLANIGGQTIGRSILVYGGNESQSRTNYKIWAWKDLRIEY